MSWFKKDEADLPESLKGKTPEEIAQAVADAAQLRVDNVALQTRVQETESRFESFGNTITELNNKVDKLGTPANPNGGGGGTEMASFLTDPDRAFAERAAPLVGLMLNASATLAKNEALRQAQGRQRTQKNNIDGTLFDRFDGEIMELAKTCTPQQLAYVATWTHLFFNVKGRHADEIVTQNIEKKGEFFVEPATRAAQQDLPTNGGLTEQEKKIASKMGVTEEAYLTRKKEMVLGVPESI